MENENYPINDPNLLLQLVKIKVREEMTNEINRLKHIETTDLLQERNFIINKFDRFYLKNIIYQIIIQSKVDDYIFKNLLGNVSVDFPIKTFNLMLSDNVNILQSIYAKGIDITSILDRPNDFSNSFLNIIDEAIITNNWKKKG